MAVICFVSYELHPTNMGGAGVLIHHAADELLNAGHEVVFLLDMPAEAFATLLSRDIQTFARPEHVRAYRVADLLEGIPFPEGQFQCVFQWKSYSFAWALGAMLEKERPDYVEFFEYCGAGYYAFVNRLYEADAAPPSLLDVITAAPVLAPLPVLGSRLHGSLEVLDRHGQGLANNTDRLILHALERRAVGLSEAVLAPSRTYYERYYRDLYKLEAERVVISNPPKQPYPRTTRRPTPQDHFSIAFLGRMFHLKGVDQLVHAAVLLMKQRPELNFTIDLIGYDSEESPIGGSYAQYLRTLIPQRLRARFIFTGQLTHAAITERLNNALFAVFPNRVESFCYALHEVYDAGVPLIINNLPAFGDFFHHERNALVYDSTTGGLVEAMRRMIDDDVLRERLCRPYPVAEHAIGDFYNAPRPLRPLAPPPAPDDSAAALGLDPLVIILGRDELAVQSPAASAIRAQTSLPARTLCLVPALPDGEETLWWLGRAWHVRDLEGNSVEPSDALTTRALVVLDAWDEPDPQWLATCTRALLRRPDMAFAGTWSAAAGRHDAATFDVAPELLPFQHGRRLARVLLRTQPGTLLADIFDPSLGSLGHTGLLWDAVHQWGHGTLLPRVMLTTREWSVEPAPASELQSLLMRHGEGFGERLALLSGLLQAQAQRPPLPTPGVAAALFEPTLSQKVQVADELGGSLLARMALKKLARRVRQGGRRPPNHTS